MERRTNLWSCCIAYNMPNQPKLLHLSDNDNARSPFNFPLNIIKKSVRVIKAKQKRAVCTAARERAGGNKSGINGRTCHSQADIPARRTRGIKAHTNQQSVLHYMLITRCKVRANNNFMLAGLRWSCFQEMSTMWKFTLK